MALPIRDGNQSLTTLSTILLSNAHIPAHTVVSLGADAITNIATAVSGVELGPNTLNALENITVTLGQVTITGGLTDAQLRASAVTIGGSVTATISGTASVTFGAITGSVSVLNIPATQAVTFSQASVTFGTAVITGSTSIIGIPSVTFTQASVTFGQSTITGSVSVLNLPATQTVTFTQASVTFGQAVVSASNITGLNNSVGTDGNTPTSTNFIKIGGHQDGSNQVEHIVHVSAGGAMKVDASDSTVTFGAVTGSVSILNFPATQTVTFGTSAVTGSVSVLNFPASQAVTFTTASVTFGTAVITGSASIIGTPSVTFTQAAVTFSAVSISNFPATQPVSIASVTVGNTVTIAGTVTANPTGTQTIAGTVTANNTNLSSNMDEANQPVLRTGVYAYDYGSDFQVGVAIIANTPAGPALNIGGTVTIGSALPAGTAQIGSVTASISGTVPVSISSVTVGNSITIGSLPAISGTVTAMAGTNFKDEIHQGILSYANGEGGDGSAPLQVNIGTLPAISGTVTIGSALPAGTNRIGVVTIGAGTVTIGAGTAQIGSVTASISNSVTIGSIPAISGVVTAKMQGNYSGNYVDIAVNDQGYLAVNVDNQISISELPALASGTNQIGSVTVGNSVTIASLPAISGTVTANTFALQGTAVTTSNFTSTTASTVLANFNAGREVLTIFNEGAGNLHICAGATCTTIAYQVRLSAGDYYEVPNHQTTITHSAVFATAGTARVTEIS